MCKNVCCQIGYNYTVLKQQHSTVPMLPSCHHTCLPTRLLCIFILACISRDEPLESSQSLEKRTPKRRSWLQPPHSQVSCSDVNSSGLRSVLGWEDCRYEGRLVWFVLNSGVCLNPFLCRVCSCSWVSLRRILSSSIRRLASQPQPRNLPMLQAEATEWATPAARRAREKALSLKPIVETERVYCSVYNIVFVQVLQETRYLDFHEKDWISETFLPGRWQAL